MDDSISLTRRWVHVLAGQIGVRLAGTEADRRAADFIEAEFGRLLPVVRRHEFRFLGWEPGTEGVLTLGGEAVPARLGIGSPPTPPEGLTGALRRLGTSPVFGVWTPGGAGPAAHLMAYTGPGRRAIPLLWEPAGGLPAGILDGDLEPRLAAASFSGEPVTFASAARLLPGATSWNVEGILPGDPRRRVVVLAHHDSVYATPGANDNAASLACLPALARRLSEVAEESRPTVHFLATGAEECGLLGARCYVRDLGWRGETAGVTLAVNFDSLTWGNTLRVGTDARGSAALEALEVAQRAAPLAAYTGVWQREAPPAGVDSAPFFAAGIPTLNINTTGDEQTVALWHTPQDTEERVPWRRVDDALALFTEFLQRAG
ncbi:MAG: M28 family metallopeptidase [Candidatus Latescibacterota bacterium]